MLIILGLSVSLLLQPRCQGCQVCRWGRWVLASWLLLLLRLVKAMLERWQHS
jgi:hypothetical protein